MKIQVVWITGLSGAGKTMLAKQIRQELVAAGESVVLLDGDILRQIFGAALPASNNYNREDRLALALLYARLVKSLTDQGLSVVIATISMFHEVYQWNRANLNGYLEVYLKVPIEELRKRDSKELYKKFEQGKITDVAGLDVSVDEPPSPDIVFEYPYSGSVDQMCSVVMSAVTKGSRNVL